MSAVAQAAVNINQQGLTGAWAIPATSGHDSEVPETRKYVLFVEKRGTSTEVPSARGTQ